ncbi:MAG TPA: NIPSNAP family protein, partial [Verrucomicrobiae bacterium]|nr:NIPSNAP family protein [Verrucomicrobiae bacterium]
MKRREFLKSSAAATSVGTLTALLDAAAAEKKPDAPREFYELRLYHLRRGPKQKLFDDFYRSAAIPAMNRAGIQPVGVFNVMFGPDSPTMYVLMPHKSLESFATAMDRVHSDAEYQKAGAEFTNAPPSDPSYVRVESSLMVSIEGMPKIEVPPAATENKPRIFEL